MICALWTTFLGGRPRQDLWPEIMPFRGRLHSYKTPNNRVGCTSLSHKNIYGVLSQSSSENSGGHLFEAILRRSFMWTHDTRTYTKQLCCNPNLSPDWLNSQLQIISSTFSHIHFMSNNSQLSWECLTVIPEKREEVLRGKFGHHC